jgi:hypothetical protein
VILHSRLTARTGPAPDEVPRLIAEVGALTARARAAFGGLSASQLNWKPAPTEWSIAQCLEHLMLINADYFPILERVARGAWTPSVKERLPLLPRLFGKMVLALVQPGSTRKVQAVARFRPSTSAIPGDIVARFAAHQDTLAWHMDAAGRRDLARTIITSPVSRVVTYSLLDAYRIIVAHEGQHMAQAERVLGDVRKSALT